MGVELAVLVTLQPAEIGVDHKLRVSVMGQDGEQIASIERGFRADSNPDEPHDFALPVQMPLQVGLTGVGVPAPGLYSVNMTVNNTSMHSVTFRADERPVPAAEEPTDT